MGVKYQDGTTLNQATWTSSTAKDTTLAAYAWGYCTALATIVYTGTFTDGVITFEGYDGYNWFVIPALKLAASSSLATTYTLASTDGNTAFYANINAFRSFRLRLSTVTTSTGSVLVNINLSAATDATA